MDDFKEHLQLIQALFNPGLRERHWDKMSEIAEQDLKPTEVYHIWQLTCSERYIFIANFVAHGVVHVIHEQHHMLLTRPCMHEWS